MKNTQSEQQKWLLRVHPNLKWRLDGPNVKNPFDTNATDSKLEEYIADRSLLMSVCSAKAFMDETEILKIVDLADMKFETVHPNLVNLDRDDLVDYLRSQGVWKLLEKEIERVQQQCREELGVRQGS
jgi:hypothetical protein